MKHKILHALNLFSAFVLASPLLVAGRPVNESLAIENQRMTRYIRPLTSQSGMTTRVSVSSEDTQANDNSRYPSISSDGHLVAFVSRASNLVSSDTNGFQDNFIHNLQAGTTERISLTSEGTQSSGFSGIYPSVSFDGRYVAFVSQASDLVSGDTNGTYDVFVRDRQAGTTECVSIANDGTLGNGLSEDPSISSDGRYVAFVSDASNLVSEDKNDTRDAFVHDRLTGATECVSVASDGTPCNGNTYHTIISSDGRYVAYYSDNGNLISEDTNELDDIFVFDRQTGITERVSVASDGTQGNGDSRDPVISSDGRYVAFVSGANNLVSGDTNEVEDIFFYDRQTDTVELVSASSEGAQGNGYSEDPAISSDGRYMAFVSVANNLVSEDTNGYLRDVFVHNRQTGATECVSVADDGTHGNGYSDNPSISYDGRYVAFESDASNLVSEDTNETADIFVRDRVGGVSREYVYLAIIIR